MGYMLRLPDGHVLEFVDCLKDDSWVLPQPEASKPLDVVKRFRRRGGARGESKSSTKTPGSVPGSLSNSTIGEEDSAELCEAASKCRVDKTHDEEMSACLQVARDKALAGGGLSGLTTVMIRHIPTHHTEHSFMEMLNGAGYAGGYDFIYVPPDKRRCTNRRVAFVNFTTTEVAEHFYRFFRGIVLEPTSVPAQQGLAILPADLQGFEANAMTHGIRSTGMQTGGATHYPIFLRPLPEAVTVAAAIHATARQCAGSTAAPRPPGRVVSATTGQHAEAHCDVVRYGNTMSL